jgi:hypothetical protein
MRHSCGVPVKIAFFAVDILYSMQYENKLAKMVENHIDLNEELLSNFSHFTFFLSIT